MPDDGPSSSHLSLTDEPPSPLEPRLPWDVVSQILTELAERQPKRDLTEDANSARRHAGDLFRMCLVSKDWRDCIQPLLWREIAFDDIADVRTRIKICSFVKIASENDFLREHVRSLLLVPPTPFWPSHPGEMLKERFQDEETWCLEALVSLVPSLVELESLSLFQGMVGKFVFLRPAEIPPKLEWIAVLGHPVLPENLIDNIASVRSLRLLDHNFNTPQNLDRVHSHLHHLSTLHIAYSLSLTHPTLALLLSGAFGRRLKDFTIDLSSRAPLSFLPPQLLAQIPNIQYLSLPFQGMRGLGQDDLPLWLDLHILHLSHSNFPLIDLECLTALVKVFFGRRRSELEEQRFPALRRIEVDLVTETAWKNSVMSTADVQHLAARLSKIGLALVGPGGSFGAKDPDAPLTFAAQDKLSKKAAKKHKREAKVAGLQGGRQ